MFGLPRTTEFNKRIPKQKFYENLTVSPALKKVFVEQVKVIYWRNKIAASTMNVTLGNYVAELEIFEVKLNTSMLDDSFLRQIAGDALTPATPDESIKETIDRDEKRQALKKQIEQLQTKIRKEKQLNRQMEMNAEVKKLRIELENL
ncbi:DUF4391 domain-containing protein [Eubacterium sp.]|uniref:DUF4391 domain-containing protein n=1 Tax=Eubacterium sp. TaxID=142586 RepID=UPI002FCBDDFC